MLPCSFKNEWQKQQVRHHGLAVSCTWDENVAVSPQLSAGALLQRSRSLLHDPAASQARDLTAGLFIF